MPLVRLTGPEGVITASYDQSSDVATWLAMAMWLRTFHRVPFDCHVQTHKGEFVIVPNVTRSGGRLRPVVLTFSRLDNVLFCVDQLVYDANSIAVRSAITNYVKIEKAGGPKINRVLPSSDRLKFVYGLVGFPRERNLNDNRLPTCGVKTILEDKPTRTMELSFLGEDDVIFDLNDMMKHKREDYNLSGVVQLDGVLRPRQRSPLKGDESDEEAMRKMADFNRYKTIRESIPKPPPTSPPTSPPTPAPRVPFNPLKLPPSWKRLSIREVAPPHTPGTIEWRTVEWTRPHSWWIDQALGYPSPRDKDDLQKILALENAVRGMRVKQKELNSNVRKEQRREQLRLHPRPDKRLGEPSHGFGQSSATTIPHVDSIMAEDETSPRSPPLKRRRLDSSWDAQVTERTNDTTHSFTQSPITHLPRRVTSSASENRDSTDQPMITEHIIPV